MTVTLAFIGIALLAIALMLWAARGRAMDVNSLTELEGRTQPVDLPAFRNLIEPEQEDFLRHNLPAAEFRAVQRERLCAAMEYVRRTAHNAALLICLGEATRRQSDPDLAGAGRELVNRAIVLRLNAFRALFLLNLRLVFPAAHASPRKVVEGYQRLTEGVLRLTRLQNPAYAPRISAVI